MPPRALPRLALALAILLAAILIPFFIWGESLERETPGLLDARLGAPGIAALAALLLAVDVVLPIPSSIISASVSFLAGPALGFFAILIGMSGGFLCGYLIGRALPEAALRRWIGAELWDGLKRRAQRSGLLWIVVSRPIPVLAEATAVLSGSLGLPIRLAFPTALVSSAAVAACYALAASLGDSGDWGDPFWLAFASSLALTVLFWFGSRKLRQQL